MILGWALITSQEIDQETCAIEYFRSLLASLCRVIPANCDSSCSMEELAKNIQRLINQMHGIFVLQTEEDQEILTRYSCWSVEIPLLLVQEYISGQRIVDPEDSLLLLSPETLSEIDPVQLEILSLVQEESQLKDVLAAANIAYGGVASSRKARKHRSSVAGDAVEEALKEIKVSHATFNVLQTPNVVELVEEFCKDSAIFGTLSNNLMALETDSANSELTSPPQQKTDESMQQKLKEYEVLLTWLKVLGQPDDIVLKKIASFEDYEERMKKLGAKLKRNCQLFPALFTYCCILCRFSVTGRSHQDSSLHPANADTGQIFLKVNCIYNLKIIPE